MFEDFDFDNQPICECDIHEQCPLCCEEEDWDNDNEDDDELDEESDFEYEDEEVDELDFDEY